MGLKRVQHWETRAYHHFLRSRSVMPFAWGTNDCAMFTADGIEAQTGTDIAAAFRGKYSSEAAALVAIRDVTEGGKTIADALAWCCAKAGIPERTYPLMAQRGDPVIVDGGAAGLQSGLVGLNGSTVLVPGDAGLRTLSIMAVKRSWSLG